MPTDKIDFANASYWQRVFLESRHNGAEYNGEQLPETKWRWPESTWMRRRLAAIHRATGDRLPWEIEEK